MWRYALIALVLIVIAPTDVLDFATPYNGASALLHGENPYSQAVTERNQLAFRGRLSVAGEDEFRTGYPAPALLLFAPLTVFPIETAATVYRVIAALALVYALARLGITPLWAFTLCILIREPVTAFMLGNAALWAAAFAAFGVDALARQHYTRAVLAFALSAVHPVTAIPLALVMLLPHRRALVTYAAIMAAGFGVSLAFGGWWVSGWIETVRAYPSYVSYMVWIPRLLPLAVVAGVAALVVAARQRDPLKRYPFAVSAVALLLPLTGLYHLTLFAPVFTRFRRWQVAAFGVCLWAFALAPFEVRQFAPLAFSGVGLLQVVRIRRLRSLGYYIDSLLPSHYTHRLHRLTTGFRQRSIYPLRFRHRRYADANLNQHP